MATMFTEFKFINKSLKPASAVVASGAVPKPTTTSTAINDVAADADRKIDPGKKLHRYARVVVLPEGKGSVEATYACDEGTYLNVLRVTLEADYTLTQTDKDCGN